MKPLSKEFRSEKGKRDSLNTGQKVKRDRSGQVELGIGYLVVVEPDAEHRPENESGLEITSYGTRYSDGRRPRPGLGLT